MSTYQSHGYLKYGSDSRGDLSPYFFSPNDIRVRPILEEREQPYLCAIIRTHFDSDHFSPFDPVLSAGAVFFIDTAEDRFQCVELLYELPDAALPETKETLTELRDHYQALANPSIRRPTPPPKHNVKPRVLAVE